MGGPTATRRPCPLPGYPHVDALSCPVGQGVNMSEPPWPVRSVSVGRARQQTIKQNWYDTSLHRSRCCPMKVSPSLRQSSCRRSLPPVTRVSKPRLALVILDRPIEAGLPPTSMPSRFSTGSTPIWSPDTLWPDLRRTDPSTVLTSALRPVIQTLGLSLRNPLQGTSAAF